MPSATESATYPYEVELSDGKKYNMEAIGDDQAIGICQKQYPKVSWKLFRMNEGQRVPVCTESPKCPPPPSEDS